MKKYLCLCAAILLAAGTAGGGDRIDVLQMTLDSIGFNRADLGVRPKGYWGRFPTDIPYKLKSFDDLFAEPLKLYDYAKSFGGAVRKFCDPARLDSLDDNLYNLTYFLGVEKKLGGFRSYGANLIDPPDGNSPLIDAIENLYLSAGQRMQFKTFNNPSDWPDLKKDLTEQIKPLSLEIRSALAGLIANHRQAAARYLYSNRIDIPALHVGTLER